MSEAPKISIIVPVYKVEPYLRKCLDSILNQTYTNLELILVDDGSPDNCGAICDEYAAKDERIIVIHQENAGVSAARNAGLDIATGDYIGFVDSDDWIELDMYKYLMHLIQEHKVDVAQCGQYFEENDRCTEKWLSAEDQADYPRGASFSPEVCNKLYQVDIVGDLRFDRNYSCGEDLMFNAQVILRIQKAGFGSRAKYHYLQRQGSACHQELTPKYLIERRIAMMQTLELLKHVSDFRTHYCDHLTLEALHFCSEIVRSHQLEFEDTKTYLRGFLRENLLLILRSKTLSLKERLKSVLIVYAWWLYRLFLLASKKYLGK